MGQQATLTVPGRYDQIQEVCEFVSAGADSAGFDEDMVFRLQLATDEACTNVIEHAYGGEDRGELRVSWHIQGRHFVIRIHDEGEPFDPEEVPAPQIPAEDEILDEKKPVELRVGGLGLYFMRELMDEVRFEFDPEGGNTLVMTKRLPQNERA